MLIPHRNCTISSCRPQYRRTGSRSPRNQMGRQMQAAKITLTMAEIEHDGNLQPRPVRESQSEMIEVVLPNDANPLGNLLGGRLMHFIDVAGALACHRHARSYVVTASIEHLDFLSPVHVGDLLILRSSVN